MPFADVFSGFEQAASDHYSKLLEMQYGQRRDAAASIAKMADDPRFDEASSMALKHRALDIIGGDPMKPLSSKDTDISQILVQPPTPPKQQMPGGQGAQNMPIAQQLTGQETAGGPQPQAPPNTGPTGQMAPQTVQPPTPPPHPLGMMPFGQQIERAHAQTVATTKYPPMKVSSVKSMDPDGKIYDYATYAGVNPSTGEYGTWSIRSDNPVSYAPRAAVGADISAEDAVRLQQAGIPDTLSNPSLEQEQAIAKMGMRLVHTGYGTFYVASQRYRPENIAGQITAVPQTPTSGNPMAGAVTLGQATSTLPKTTTGQQTIQLPGGRLGVTGTQRTTTTELPGAPAPQAPPVQPPAAPPGMSAAPGQVPEQAIQQIMAANPRLTREQAIAGLQGSGPASIQDAAGSAPPQVPPPTAPPQAGMPKVGDVRELPGAGRRLSAEQVMQTGQKAEAYQNTVERAIGLLQGFTDPKMRSILERAKLHIVTSPDTGIKLVLGNLASLNPKEAKMAADFVSLSEDVNVLRSMYGATGFRSKEALAVLLGQRGELLENPQVFSGVLRNTLQSIVSQLEPIVSQLSDNGKPVTITAPLATAYKYLNNNDAVTARQKALAAKYKLPE